MKIGIVGSTGKIGKQVITQAITQGHSVTAFARNPEKLRAFDNQISIVQGDVLKPASLLEAITGQDAVICTLGMPLMNKDGIRARGTKNIISVMEEAKVKRLICLSSMGVGGSRESLPARYRYLIIPLFMKHLLADHTKQEKLITNSNLDWSIIRPASFSEGRSSGGYWHGMEAAGENLSFKISLDDVAEFILKQLHTDTYLKLCPGISYRNGG